MSKKILKSKSAKNSTKAKIRRAPKSHIYGIEHEFIIITGGGFLVVVLSVLLFF